VTDEEKLDLSMTQIISGVLVTITVAAIGSLLGPAGTLIGAALTSTLSTVAGALYKHGLTKTGTKLKTVATKRKIGDSAAGPGGEYTVTETKPTRKPFKPTRKMYATLGATTAVTAIAALGALTATEAFAGKPVSAIIQNKSGSGTTLGGGHVTKSTPVPTSIPSNTTTSRQQETTRPSQPVQTTPSQPGRTQTVIPVPPSQPAQTPVQPTPHNQPVAPQPTTP
jgi:hypothetical protein